MQDVRDPGNGTAVAPPTNEALAQVSPEETELTARVTALWKVHSKHATAAKRTRQELATVRMELAENLHHLKNRYCRAGRDGEWSSFLSSRGIPRASADRHVKRYQQSLGAQNGNLLTEASRAITSADVTKLSARVLSKFGSLRTTPVLRPQCIDALTGLLAGNSADER